MPEIFYLAARFPSLEAAGQAYTPIQELLRSYGNTDLLVFRLGLSGVPIVAVVGIEPPAPVLEAIKEALSLGETVILPDEAVGWLLERREQRLQGAGFSEAHYTRETGPRVQFPSRTRRGRVSTLPVTWQDEVPTREEAQGSITNLQTGEVMALPPTFVGVCDWCTAELAPPIAAIDNFAVELTFPDGFVTATGGKWATCRMCQGRLRLKPGDSEVAFDAVDRLWRTHGSRYLGESVHRVKIRTFYQEGG
jgi:hypothetical protein